MPSPFKSDEFSSVHRDERPASTTLAFRVWAAFRDVLARALFIGPVPGSGPPEPGMQPMAMYMGAGEEEPGRRVMGRNAASRADPLGPCHAPCKADIREAVRRPGDSGVRGPLATTCAALDEMISVPSASTPIPPPRAPMLRTEQPREPEPATDSRAVASRGDANVVHGAGDGQLGEPGTAKPSPAREVHSVSYGEPGGWGVICEGVPGEDTDSESVGGEDSSDGLPDARAAGCVPHVRVSST